MAATPQYGGTNSVPELNIGQPGSARATANTARYVVKVTEGADQAAIVDQQIVEQNVSFEDNLGRQTSRVVWSGNLKVNSRATWRAIVNELNSYKHGSSRSSGVLTAPDPALLKPTRLTDSDGNVISESARLESWAMGGSTLKLHNDPNFDLIVVGLRVVFKLLA